METTLRTDITIKDVCVGFIYNELEGKGLFGLSGKLTIQPEYQRNYIYAQASLNISEGVKNGKVNTIIIPSNVTAIGSFK